MEETQEQKPIEDKYFIVLDTETTGTVANGAYSCPATNLDVWNQIVIQLAFNVYKNTIDNLVDSYSEFIQPVGWDISKSQWHRDNGITMEMCQAGVPIETAMLRFIAAIDQYDNCSIVAHNLSFDFGMIAAEMVRVGVTIAGFDAFYDLKESGRAKLMLRANKKPTRFCTLKLTWDLCRLPNANPEKYGKDNNKMPGLAEVHRFLFGTDFTGAHNAKYDVGACAKIFFELKRIAAEMDIPNLERLQLSYNEELTAILAKQKEITTQLEEVNAQIHRVKELIYPINNNLFIHNTLKTGI